MAAAAIVATVVTIITAFSMETVATIKKKGADGLKTQNGAPLSVHLTQSETIELSDLMFLQRRL
jgi:hypothetical protein